MEMIDVRGVGAITGDSVSQTWKRAADDSSDFPKPVKIGGKTLWVKSEIEDYLRRKVEEYRATKQEKRASVFKAARASTARRTGVA